MSFLPSMTLRGPGENNRDSQTRQIQENLTNVEKHFGHMCQLFAAFTRKTARLRDKGDMLVKEIGLYADTETPKLKEGLMQFGLHLAKIQDYRQAEVERLECKVVEPLKSYGAVVKLKREDLKVTLSAKDREAKRMAQLERTRQRNPSDRQIISQAENELQRATVDARRTTKQLAEAIYEFDKKKIQDIKKILCDFVSVEMSFHAKALELYTSAYQSIKAVEEEDEEEQQRTLICQQQSEEDEEDSEEEEDDEEDDDEEDS